MQNAHKQGVRYTAKTEKEIRIAVTVGPKEASHQALLTLLINVGSAEKKNYRKEKKVGCITCVRERDELRNTGHTAMAATQIIPLRYALVLKTKKTLPTSTRSFST